MKILSLFKKNLPLPFAGQDADSVWAQFKKLAAQRAADNPLARDLLQKVVLDNASLARGLSLLLAEGETASQKRAAQFLAAYRQNPALVAAAVQDLRAVVDRDPAVGEALTPFLYFKGFHAIQLSRLAHWFWGQGRKDDALFLQNRGAVVYGVDIHPAAQIGTGLMLDHATGLVVGETAVIEDHVSLLHGVTLGGTGKEQGDRHPKVRQGVMIGAGAKILGNVEVGAGACIAAGSVVLRDVPPHVTVAGIPAKIVGIPRSATPADEMDQSVIPENA